MQTSLTDHAKEQIRRIHALSDKHSRSHQKTHMETLLELVAEHADEVAQLYADKDQHYLVETGDLLILCLEILAESNTSADALMDKCYKRYFDKLSFLIESSKKE